MNIIGIIPARGGSIGISKKNLQKIGDKTLLDMAIFGAIESSIFDRIIVSSDDDALLHIARQYPEVEVLFKRPQALSGGDVPTADVVLHLLNWLKMHENYVADSLMLLEPTCPFRTPQELRGAYKIFCDRAADSLISVSPPLQHPCDMIYKNDEQKFQSCLVKKITATGRQGYDEAWFINGAIFMTAVPYFLRNKKFYDLSSCIIYKMTELSGIDIDTPFDLEIAIACYKYFGVTRIIC